MEGPNGGAREAGGPHPARPFGSYARRVGWMGTPRLLRSRIPIQPLQTAGHGDGGGRDESRPYEGRPTTVGAMVAPGGGMPIPDIESRRGVGE